MLFKSVAALTLAGLAVASPVKRANNTGTGYNDVDILNYALTLEHLEASFYREGLKMYNAGAFDSASFPDWVRTRFSQIASQEATHVTFLSTALSGAGATPVKECTYDFGLMSPETFLATAQVLEGVGVAAYLGAAPSISNKAYLAVAGSILVVEAQHETWLRSAADTQDPFPKPFAAPLDFNQVFTLAAPFIKSCPADSPALPFKAFPSVTVNTKGPYKCKETISVEVPKSSGTVYAAFVDATNTQFQDITKSGGKVTIPEGIAGQSYLILTSGPSVKDSATIAGPAIIFVESD